MSTRAAPPARFSFITLLVGLVCFLVVPVTVSVLIPASWITLTRGAGGQVSATSRTCLLFVVPWRVQHVAEVTKVEADLLRGDRRLPQRSRGHGSPNRGYIHSDGEAELTVAGQGESLTVKVSPESVEEVKIKVQAFLGDPSQRSIRLFTIANWKFGLGFGIPSALLAALYLIGSSLAILRKLWRSKPACAAGGVPAR